MKIRNGFVSNSSSSSFIIGYGVIKHEQAFIDYCRQHKIRDSYNVKIVRSEDKTANSYNAWYELSGGNCSSMTIPAEYHGHEPIVVVEILNDEGDSVFSTYDENGDWSDMDYDQAKDPDFFPEDQQAIIEMLENKDLFIASDVYFGAERNG